MTQSPRDALAGPTLGPSGDRVGFSLASPAVRMGLSIAVATGLYGISFGALAVTAGLSV